MFTRQAPNIAEALFLSGIPQASVAAAQNLLGQCRARIEHRGPVRFDYTNPNFRLITPQNSLISNHGNGPPPEEFPPEDPGPEEDETNTNPLKPPRPQPPEPVEQAPRQPPPPPGPGEGGGPGAARAFPGGNKYTEGDYIEILPRRKAISLRANDARRHPVWPVALTRPQEVGSVDYRTEARDEDFQIIPFGTGFVELDIQERTQQTLWRLYVKHLEPVELVTNVELETDMAGNSQLTVSRVSGYIFRPQPLADGVIALSDVDYLTDVTLGPTSLDFSVESARVFSPVNTEATISIPLAECPAP